ncbi:MAG: hypothetical protein LBC92_05125 [Rickettsiales bacterium]|jgi:acetyltransferase-like isoleucine patch superfamily enzyme|nr:hypothetical protein [Rickettsiales bacterium]
MFSCGIVIYASDVHSIFDIHTKKLLNRVSSPLIIGNHCWIGRDVKLLKNAGISNNTIVGMGSVVTKKFTESYIAIAGNPAKIIKRDIDWTRENPHGYLK